MASIDQYKHKHLGFISCPSDFDIVENNPTREIAVYQLLEDIPEDETDFDGKAGDILVGGGGGEVAAFRITMPDALNLLVHANEAYFRDSDELFKSFWTSTDAYKLCDGFRKLGWDARRPVEAWLAENVCLALTNEVESFRSLRKEQETESQLKWRAVNSNY